MTSVITFLVFAALIHTLIILLFKGADRKWVSKVSLAASLCLFLLLVLINFWFPFSGGGDDHYYFSLAATPFHSLSDLFDLTKFTGFMAQPGYPWLLSILYQLTGEDILSYKLLNLAFFIVLIHVWYLIGIELDTNRFGRAMAIVILLLTPIWFYWMFLLKDMVISLLQSVFLLGTVQVSRNKSKGGWLLILVATLAIIPFRSQLVLFNLTVVLGTFALMMVRRGQRRMSLATLIIATIVFGGVLNIASNPERMAALGIDSGLRLVGSDSTREMAAIVGEASVMKKEQFPLLYLLTETSGLSPQSWADFNAGSLRGVLALPWIFVAVPFFVFGLIWLMRRDPQTIQRRGIVAGIRSMRLVATPWGSVLIFILGYMVVSWTVGDTTRWRIPDLPAMAAVALAGWMSMAEKLRMQVLLLWVTISGGLFAMYYLIRGL